MLFEYETDKKTKVPCLRVGARRLSDRKLGLVFVLDKRGHLKPAQDPTTTFNLTIMVKLEVGDTIFMLRTSMITHPGAANYYLEGQNVRNLREGKVTGPEVKQWVPGAFLPLPVRDGIERWCNHEQPLGKNFVSVDPRLKAKNPEMVYSTEAGPDESEIHSDTRVAIFGKRRRAV